MNTTLLSVLCALQLGTAAPQETTPSPAPEATPQDTSPVRLRPVVIYQTPKDLSRGGGSAHKISEKELKKQKYDAPDQALYSVPGVYIRQEDGYGLRPNIGLRGANSDRSKKVTL